MPGSATMLAALAVKHSEVGLAVYAAMALILLALGLYLGARVAAVSAAGNAPRTGATRATAPRLCSLLGTVLFGAGSAVVLGAWVWRWQQVQHVPLKDLFEVFLCLGWAVFPLALFCRHVLKAASPTAEALIALVLLFPAGFSFQEDARPLMPALQSPLFLPHVAAYVLAYVILYLASVQAGKQLIAGARRALAEDRAAGRPPGSPQGPLVARAIESELSAERATYRLVRFGFPLLTLGLILGAVWGKLAWGDYWNWDPKEMWSLASFLIFVLYLHVRHALGPRLAWLNSTLVLLGTLACVLTLLWANLSRLFPGLHSYAAG